VEMPGRYAGALLFAFNGRAVIVLAEVAHSIVAKARQGSRWFAPTA
jgi:hypothetical protein